MRCLEGLEHQTLEPDEVLVVMQATDHETIRALDRSSLRNAVRSVIVEVPGHNAALSAGIAAARGEVVAVVDDDAVPHPDWVGQIERHFRIDDRLGALGGRDLIYRDGVREDGAEPIVGRVQFFGRHIGNHHLGVGGPRPVEIVKGANMSFRRTAVAAAGFDRRLRGSGVQMHNDMAVTFALRRAGWRILYDPRVKVDHNLGPRFDETVRQGYRPIAIYNEVHNETLNLVEYLPPLRRYIFLVWSVVVGTRNAPGLVQLPRLAARREPQLWARWRETLRGRVAGYRTARSSGPVSTGEQDIPPP